MPSRSCATVQDWNPKCENDERGISGGANENRATRGSATGGASKNRATGGSATGGPVAEARQGFRAAGARARTGRRHPET